MSLRLRRLQADYEVVKALAHRHPAIEVEGVAGNPPDRYRLVYSVRSLREKADRLVIAKSHRVEVVLPAGYPRDAPLCRMLTPVFHPNIAPHAICIGDHWSAAESLDQMIQRIGQMLTFQSYNLKSPLNGRAAQWVERNLAKLPIDRTEFFMDGGATPPPAAEGGALACANCAATTTHAATCPAGHALCENCAVRCEGCGALLCLVCGTTRCDTCHPFCANCGSTDAKRGRCEAGHALCEDCGTRCEECGRWLCLACGTYPCPDCAA